MNIDDIVKSKTHLKIVRFFHENQSSIDTPRGVATWIGESREKAVKALEDLVKLKILIADRSPSTTGYSYTRDDKMIAKIQKLIGQIES